MRPYLLVTEEIKQEAKKGGKYTILFHFCDFVNGMSVSISVKGMFQKGHLSGGYFGGVIFVSYFIIIN